jgi:hypothetical protein
LSFPNARIKYTITSLGISIGSNIDNSTDIIKELEYKRLFDAPNIESTNKVQNTSTYEITMQFNISGDIAEDMLGTDGSPLSQHPDIKK